MNPNDSPVYVHEQSNHLPRILQNIPMSVNKRLNSISSSKEVFSAAKPPYQQALKFSGYNFDLRYILQNASEKINRRQRRITWFKPPISQNVESNIGGKCLKQRFVYTYQKFSLNGLFFKINFGKCLTFRNSFILFSVLSQPNSTLT